ncbi:G protein-coupled glucose receptor regulating Gpa2-domain-containing protein [Dactylonectria estremocensis]|uniref:G protein-coupled glucose receptor regulating Gpa2-domain-containing protein n=1 Tax=Dactylonectria estremocensis TaxID=1079267 RepID=A0A9P9E3I8_9HYPO|nr:G protein-coupled glucose receptor regulating Gpa2-domain-containing protein [Dactylonectria estremocensis]
MTVDVDQAVAAVTLVGSLLSCLATTFVLISFAVYRRQLHSFRHVLVLNLTVAEFINSLNNSVSGAIFISTRELRPGAACVVNGLVGQLSVQAADFSILAIALVTLLTVTRVLYAPTLSTSRKLLSCIAIWIIPAVTSIVATAMGQMAPVGGNWCWISAGRPDLRYALTHGWRFFVIFSTIAIYLYIWLYLRQNLWPNNGDQNSSSYGLPATNSAYSCFGTRSGFKTVDDEEDELDELNRPSLEAGKRPQAQGLLVGSQRPDEIERDRSMDNQKGEGGDSDEETRAQSGTINGNTGGHSKSYSRVIVTDLESPSPAITQPNTAYLQTQHNDARQQGNVLQTNQSEFPMRRQASQVEREIKRMMLLNGYPLMYVLLWIPGLVNRLMEASGHKPSPTTMAALQVSTQFVGVANALTYGFNHHLRDRLKVMYLTPAVIKTRRTFERRGR